MIKLRRITQVVSLLFFMILLIVAAQPGEALIRVVDIYPRMSPLLFAATWLNTFKFPVAFIPAIVLIAATLVFGRFFCGWICPLGVTFDASDKWLGPRKRDDSAERLKWKPVKYAMLVGALVAAYFEANVAGWLDPLSFATKLYSLVLLPGAEFASRLALRGLKPLPIIGNVADNVYSVLKTSVYSPEQPRYSGMLAIFLLYLAAALLVYVNRRFWCRFLCPAGATLALVSRFSIIRRKVDLDKCVRCKKCERNCRMGAITEGGTEGYGGECVECFTCKDVCPTEAIKFTAFGAGADKRPVNFGRRGFMASVAGAAVAIPLVRIAPGKPGAREVRPPGATSEDFLMQACLRCGECMRVCPTNGLQPVWLESGLEGLWTPKLSTRVGYCEFSCLKCGQICPSNAIKELDLKTKQKTVIGRAVFDKNRCIPWSRGQDCAVCEEHCPVADKAIRLREAAFLDDDGKTVPVYQPYVVEDICIGCGTCEFVCPVEGAAGVLTTGVAQVLLDIRNVAKPEAGESGRAPGPSNPNVSKAAPATAAPPSPAAAAATAAIPLSATQPDAPVAAVTPPPIADGRLPVQLKPLLPETFRDWRPDGGMKLTIPSNLYDLINGGSEVYLEFGFVKGLRRNYANGDKMLTADVFFMKDVTAAYGIFLSEHAPGEAPAGVGRDSAVNDYEIKFWQDRYYVKLSGDASKGEFVELAKYVSAAIGTQGSTVPEVSWRAEGFAAARSKDISIIRGPLALKRVFDFSDRDIFGFSSGAAGAGYRIAKNDNAFIVRLKPGRKLTAAAAEAEAAKALAAKGMSPAKSSPAIALPKGYSIFEGDGNTVALRASGGFVDIVVVTAD